MGSGTTGASSGSGLGLGQGEKGPGCGMGAGVGMGQGLGVSAGQDGGAGGAPVGWESQGGTWADGFAACLPTPGPVGRDLEEIRGQGGSLGR